VKRCPQGIQSSGQDPNSLLKWKKDWEDKTGIADLLDYPVDRAGGPFAECPPVTEIEYDLAACLVPAPFGAAEEKLNLSQDHCGIDTIVELV